MLAVGKALHSKLPVRFAVDDLLQKFLSDVQAFSDAFGVFEQRSIWYENFKHPLNISLISSNAMTGFLILLAASILLS